MEPINRYEDDMTNRLEQAVGLGEEIEPALRGGTPSGSGTFAASYSIQPPTWVCNGPRWSNWSGGRADIAVLG
jgi:hypothetical protein